MSPGLQATLLRAREYAASQSEAQVLLEHLLLALTEDADAAHVLSACRVDLGRVRGDVGGYLNTLDDRVPQGTPGAPAISQALTQVLKYATLAAQQGRRNSIDGAIVLAALVGDGRSMAANFLKTQGLTFEAAIQALRQAATVGQGMAPQGQNGDGAPQPAPQSVPSAYPQSAPPAGNRTEDILANARRRVETRRQPGPEAARHELPGEPFTSPPETFAPPPATEAPPPADETPAQPAPSPDAGYERVRVSPDSGAPVTAPAPSGHHGIAEHGTPGGSVPAEAPPPAPAFEPPEAAPPLPDPIQRPEPALQATEPPPAPFAPPAAPDDLRPATTDTSRASPPHPGPGPAVNAGPHASQTLAPQAPTPPTERAPGPPQIPPFEPQSPPQGWAPPPIRPATPPPAPTRSMPPPPQGWPSPPTMPGQPPRPSDVEPALSAPHHWSRPQASEDLGREATSPGPGYSPTPLVPVSSGSGRRPAVDASQVTTSFPRRLKLGRAQVIEVWIERPPIAGSGGSRSFALRPENVVARAISVRLRPVSGTFAIEAASPETQWDQSGAAGPNRLSSEAAVWRFMVTPLKSGAGKLQLAISARTLGADGVLAETQLPDQSHDVRVLPSPGVFIRKLLTILGAGVLGMVVIKLVEAEMGMDFYYLFKQLLRYRG